MAEMLADRSGAPLPIATNVTANSHTEEEKLRGLCRLQEFKRLLGCEGQLGRLPQAHEMSSVRCCKARLIAGLLEESWVHVCMEYVAGTLHEMD